MKTQLFLVVDNGVLTGGGHEGDMFVEATTAMEAYELWLAEWELTPEDVEPGEVIFYHVPTLSGKPRVHRWSGVSNT